MKFGDNNENRILDFAARMYLVIANSPWRILTGKTTVLSISSWAFKDLTHLDQSQSGRSRGWIPHCPCVSSPPPLGCSGLQHCCLPSAAPAGAEDASARALETPAGTGSSYLSLQVSGQEKEKGETGKRLITCTVQRRYECVVLQISINFIIELSVQYFHDKHSPAPAGAFSQNLCRISLLPALKSPQWFPSPACEHCPAWFTPSLCLRLVPYEQGAMVEIDRAVLCSNLTASRHGRRQAWLPASDQNNGPSISDGETEVDSSRRAEWRR